MEFRSDWTESQSDRTEFRSDWTEFRSEWTEFRWIGWNSNLIEQNLVKVSMPKKKLAWTDLDRVDFKKLVKESRVEIKKSAWTGLDKVKKVSSNASVSSKSLFTTGHKKSLDLTRGAVDATPFAVAFSLTFSLVKK
jgi:hypothetical protein